MGKCVSAPCEKLGDLPETSAVSRPATEDGCPFAERLEPNELWQRYARMHKDPLGKGVSGSVHAVKRKSDGERLALKTLKRSKPGSLKLFKREVGILQHLRDHPHIIQYDCSLVDDANFVLLTKLCKGGPLFQRIRSRKHYSEAEAAKVVATVLSTVAHMHEHDIVHRDIKLENIVYSDEGAEGRLVLIDFGEALRVTEKQRITILRGTLPYCAPELWKQREKMVPDELKRADVWSIGVMTYVILTGHYPFMGETKPATIQAIQGAPLRFRPEVALSESARDFVRFLLNRDPRDRPTCKEALTHPWLQTEAQKHRQHLGDAVLQSLGRTVGSKKLRQQIVAHLARHTSDEDRATLEATFEMIDVQQKGVIERDDLIAFHKQASKYDSEEVERRADATMRRLAPLGSNKIDREQFVCARKAAALNHTYLAETFDWLDVDQDGFISVADMKAAISTEQNTVELQEIIDEADKDGDGLVSRQDFVWAMHLESLVKEEDGDEEEEEFDEDDEEEERTSEEEVEA